jgi:hypothetical protein
LGGLLELYMPALRPDYEKFNPDQKLPYMTQEDLNRARRWLVIDFTGNGIKDFISIDNMRQYVQALQRDSSYKIGVRIRFNHRVSYACFMEVLFTLWGENYKYWLDVRHESMTLYVVTFPPKPIVAD